MGLPTVPDIFVTVFPDTVAFTNGAPMMPQYVETPVFVIPETVLLVTFTNGEATMMPAVLSKVPALVKVDIVLPVIDAAVTFPPAWKLIPRTAALLPVFVVVIFVILFPETVTLSLPVETFIPVGASAFASEIFPILFLDIVAPLAPIKMIPVRRIEFAPAVFKSFWVISVPLPFVPRTAA